MQTPLPTTDMATARMLRRHCERMDIIMAAKRTVWLLAWYYLNGYRRFNVYDPENGRLAAHQLDEEGNMEFQSQELLAYINQVAGRIQGMDLRPQVDATSHTLGALRNRALNQIILDGTVSEHEIERAKEEYSFLFSCLGFAGIMCHLEDHPTIGLTAGLEVIHPRELYPFPVVEQDISKCRGIVRQRMVSLDYLREVYGPKVLRNIDEIEWFSQLPEDPWMETYGKQGTTPWTRREKIWPDSSGYNASEKAGDGIIRTVKVRELWVTDPGGRCQQYVVGSGNFLFDKQDLSDKEVYCPIGWSRFLNNGTFHGAGMFELMFSQHRQLELMAKSLFDNIRDIDRYGVVVLPQGQMNQNQLLRDVGRGLRVLWWDPDVAAEGFRPFNIQPFNAGDAPGKVAAFAREGLQLINPIRDLASEKGRADSAEALQFLNENLTQNLAVPSQGAVRAWSDAYRSLAQKISFDLLTTERAMPVSNLTLDLAGAVIDLKEDKVHFANNPIPTVSRLRFTVRSMSPRSELARKQEIMSLWEKGLEQDPMSVKLLCMKEGLDMGLYMDDLTGAYEASVRIILTNYGDGQRPGEIMLTPYTIDADLLLRLASGFMKGPHLQVASDEVIERFYQLREFAMQALGLTLPNAMPTPEDMAVLSQMPGGGMLPPAQAPQPQGMPNAQQPVPAR